MIKRIFQLSLILLFGFTCSVKSQGRVKIDFNSDWEFKKADYNQDPALISAGWEQINIPHTWNNADMQMSKNFYQGDAFYRKNFYADESWKGKQIYIRFEGVAAVADVYINNHFMGEHRGGYSAFVFDISDALKWNQQNTILVKVNNASRPDVIPVNHNLFGVYGGIYRPVSLIVTNKLLITTSDYASPGVYIRQKKVAKSRAEIIVSAKIENKTRWIQPCKLEFDLCDMKGNTVKRYDSGIEVLPQGRQTFTREFSVENPHLWSGLDDPYLYKLITRIKQNGIVVDEVSQPLGIRHFEAVAGKGFYLNGRLYPLYGVTRHQDYWGYGSALSNKQHAADLADIIEMGATSIRLAHYQQAEYIYAKADSLGLIIWAEIPFVNAVSGKEADNAKQQLTELIRQNFNHPSIYVWGLHNEVYGKSPGDYATVLTATLHDLAKSEDPDRYTVSVSGYGEVDRPTNLQADIQGINRYYGWYEGQTADLDGWLQGLKKNFPEYKVILSEYGAEGNVLQQSENPPQQVNPVSGQFFPEQLETRSHEIQWGIIQKNPGLIGSYLWNMFDFAVPLWSRGGVPARNMKGLVTFDRKIKKDAFYWYKANWSKEPVLYISDRRLIMRKNAVTDITVYSNRGTPVLTINGKPVKGVSSGTTSVHFIFKNMTLQKGKNIIHVAVENNGHKYSDQVEWILE